MVRNLSRLVVGLVTSVLLLSIVMIADIRHRAEAVSASSFWTAPVGSSAVLQPSGIGSVANGIPFDVVYVIRSTNADPERPLIQSGSWLSRCTGTVNSGINVRVPDSFVIPEARVDFQPNNHFVFVAPDGDSTVSVTGGARCNAGGNVYGLWYPDVRGSLSDLRYGTHASRLSALGGAIRAGELSGPDPIRHALDVGVWGHENLWWSGSRGDCFRWPALDCDAYAADRTSGYNGTNPNLKMGALLAIPTSVTPESLGITSDVGRKLLRAFQEYGAYITEDTMWDSYNLSVTGDAQGTFPWSNTEQNDFKKLMVATSVVTNNVGGATAGGGTPVSAGATPATTTPVVTNPPATNPPATNPPVTNPPFTPAPVTAPPATNPPVTPAPSPAPTPATTAAPAPGTSSSTVAPAAAAQNASVGVTGTPGTGASVTNPPDSTPGSPAVDPTTPGTAPSTSAAAKAPAALALVQDGKGRSTTAGPKPATKSTPTGKATGSTAAAGRSTAARRSAAARRLAQRRAARRTAARNAAKRTARNATKPKARTTTNRPAPVTTVPGKRSSGTNYVVFT